jgi:thiol-disulfide isomerase/thioredoxin
MTKAFLLFLVFGACSLPAHAPAQQAAKTKAPGEEISIKLRGIDGHLYDSNEMRGSVLLISFGATWCKPCDAELRALEELKKEYGNRPVRFFWVSIERVEEVSDKGLRDFAKRLKLSFPVLRDGGQFTYAQFSTRVRVPLLVFFDREGNFAPPTHFGMSTSTELYKRRVRERLNGLLAAQSSGAR